MQTGDEQAERAWQLLAGAFHGVLSTHSHEHEGYPFGSVVPYVLDANGLPLMLLSHLSQHTRNLDADPRCGLTVMEPGDGDVQQRGRLSAIGEVLPVAPATDAGHYFDYFPHSRPYYDQLGFRFYRFTPRRFHWNGGFATARWFASDRLIRANPLPCDVRARIVGHMNQDHSDALSQYLNRTDIPSDAAVAMVGIDATGMDLRVADTLHRVALLRPIASADEAREVLVEMAATRP